MIGNYAHRSAAAIAASLVITSVTSVRAADPASAPPVDPFVAFRLLDELRFGGFAHNPGQKERGTVDVSVEVLSSRLHSDTGNRLLDYFLSPRLNAGVMANTGGKTSYGYAGFVWTADLTEAIFLETGFGAAVNTGKKAPTDDRAGLGCALTFRESLALGYRVSESVNLTVGVEHISHAQLCGKHNAGLTNVGARIGYRF